jgi:hypothetical protein
MESTGRLVLAGAGHAHLRLIHTISRLRAQNISVTVVDPGDTLWYSGMMPAVLGGTVDPSAARINVRAIVERQGGEYVSEALTEIRADDRTALTASGRTLPWDVMSVAVGSTVVPPFPVAPSGNLSVFAAKPIVALLELSRCVRELIVSRTALGDERPVRVAFVGGGPSTVELAGNLAGGILRDRSDAGSRLRIGVYTQAERLLPRMPVAAATAAERSLASQGVGIRYGTEIRRITETGLELGDATVEEWDVAVLATGLGHQSSFAGQGSRRRRTALCGWDQPCGSRAHRYTVVATASPLKDFTSPGRGCTPSGSSTFWCTTLPQSSGWSCRSHPQGGIGGYGGIRRHRMDSSPTRLRPTPFRSSTSATARHYSYKGGVCAAAASRRF